MKEILILFFGLLMVFLAIILPDIIGNYIDDKREKREKKDGIEGRWVTTGYAFYIYTIYKNEKYYLNNDGNFLYLYNKYKIIFV